MAAASEPPMVEQVITEFFAKSLHIILESRSPYVSSRNFAVDRFLPSPSSSPSSPCSPSRGGQPRDKWFNLALRDCPAALENFDLWRQSNLEPLVIDIVLLRRSGQCLARSHSGNEGSLLEADAGGKIVERWVIQYESRKASVKNSSRKPRGSSACASEGHTLYRRTYAGSTVLLRSLYLVVRLLPAYNLFRELNSSGRILPLSLSHKISSFVEPFTRAEDAEMNHFAFPPIQTPFGRLGLSVSYVPTLEVVASEPSTPLPAELIPDYVDSPTTDFLKRFQSLPSPGISSACIAMTRRHSWSIDHGAGTSVSPSPSPTYSEPRALHWNQSPRLPPRGLMYDNPVTAVQNKASLSGQKKSATSEKCYRSPPSSPLPAPSPSGAHLKNPLFRCESAPARAGGGSGLPPPPLLKGKHPCSSQNDSPRAQVTTASPDGELQIKKDLVSLGEFKGEKALHKALSFGRDDMGYFHALKLPRTSSRHFLMDELDDLELVFAGDERDIVDQLNRAEISDGGDPGGNRQGGGSHTLTRSPAAAVGALVHMLKFAPGLRESLPSITSPQIPPNPSAHGVMAVDSDNAGPSSAVVSSGILRSMTAADALEELRKYGEMKESILSRGGLQQQNSDKEKKSADGDP